MYKPLDREDTFDVISKSRWQARCSDSQGDGEGALHSRHMQEPLVFPGLRHRVTPNVQLVSGCFYRRNPTTSSTLRPSQPQGPAQLSRM